MSHYQNGSALSGHVSHKGFQVLNFQQDLSDMGYLLQLESLLMQNYWEANIKQCV